MNKNIGPYQVVDLPRARRIWLNTLDLSGPAHSMYGLLEVDVTAARQFIAEHRKRTGESLSFTGFLAFCLARAVDEDKSLQAYIKGRNQLVLFDDVDVGLMVERKVGEKYALMGHVIRGANRKTYREIHEEIRSVQAEPVPLGRGMPAWFRSAMALPWPLSRLVKALVGMAMRRDPTIPVSMAGTVGITAVGMFGKGHSGWGLYSTPHSLGLVVGSTAWKPAVVEGRLEPREILHLTVLFDHNVIDGAPAARFTRRLVELVESGYGLCEMEGKDIATDQNSPASEPQRAVQESATAGSVPARAGWVRDWQHWAPYAAIAWSLVYAALGIYWVESGRGFPYAPEAETSVIGPAIGRFGPGVAWIAVLMAGIPAAAVGTAMLRGVRGRAIRPLIITFGALLAGVLLLLMTDITLLMTVAYIPYAVVGFLTGAEFGQVYLEALTQWTFVHQSLCLTGGFLWLAATISYSRRSGDACLNCGRRDSPEGWTSPVKAASWGRIAVVVAMIVPVFYALTRYAWALGIPLGISDELLRSGQESGIWTSGLFLATFGLVGAALTLGLVGRWGEVFPRWTIGLAGRQVPIALAVVPAAIVSVLIMVGGIAMWSGYNQMAGEAAASGQSMGIVVGPVALFPIWAVSLAAATLGYYYRRRGPCKMCGHGRSDKSGEPLARHSQPDGPLPEVKKPQMVGKRRSG